MATEKVRPRVQQKPVGESRTQQHFQPETDINALVKKHLGGPNRFSGLSGVGNPNATRQLHFGEVPSESYHEMLNKVTDVQNLFRSLPSRVRGRFRDPYQLLRWVENPENREEALKSGFIHDPDALQDIMEKEAQADEEAAQAAQQTSLVNPDPDSIPPAQAAPQAPKKGAK